MSEIDRDLSLTKHVDESLLGIYLFMIGRERVCKGNNISSLR